jgi:hypothetical protein
MRQVTGSPEAGGRAAGGERKPVGIGQGKPPRTSQHDPADEDARRAWAPGRGATRKKGNPRRSAKRSRRR